MARGIGQRHHATEGRAEHDRVRNAERVTERAHVVAPVRQLPCLSRTILAAAVAAMVEIDDLGNIGQGGVGRLVNRMVEAGTTMEQEQGRLLPHHRGGASGTYFAPSTSKDSRTPFTDTCMSGLSRFVNGPP